VFTALGGAQDETPRHIREDSMKNGNAILILLALALVACGGSNRKEPTDTHAGGDTSDTVDHDTATCEPGTSGCECAELRCDAGLSCVDGKCAATSSTELRLSPASARACDILLEDVAGAKVSRVLFSDDVKGHAIREGERTAVSVISRTDSGFAANGVTLELIGDGQVSPKVATVSCSDKLGKKLADTSASVD
jgi:hypothetical protein